MGCHILFGKKNTKHRPKKIKKMNLIGAPYQIIIGKKTEGEILEFQEVGKEPQKISLKEIIKILKEQKLSNQKLIISKKKVLKI